MTDGVWNTAKSKIANRAAQVVKNVKTKKRWIYQPVAVLFFAVEYMRQTELLLSAAEIQLVRSDGHVSAGGSGQASSVSRQPLSNIHTSNIALADASSSNHQSVSGNHVAYVSNTDPSQDVVSNSSPSSESDHLDIPISHRRYQRNSANYAVPGQSVAANSDLDPSRSQGNGSGSSITVNTVAFPSIQLDSRPLLNIDPQLLGLSYGVPGISFGSLSRVHLKQAFECLINHPAFNKIGGVEHSEFLYLRREDMSEDLYHMIRNYMARNLRSNNGDVLSGLLAEICAISILICRKLYRATLSEELVYIFYLLYNT